MGDYTTHCIVCDTFGPGRMLVKIVETMSGPGRGLYACAEPCAQQYARRRYAPDWLRDDLRKLGLWPAEGSG